MSTSWATRISESRPRETSGRGEPSTPAGRRARGHPRRLLTGSPTTHQWHLSLVYRPRTVCGGDPVKSRYGDTASCDDVDRNDRIGEWASSVIPPGRSTGRLPRGRFHYLGYDDFHEAREERPPGLRGGIVTQSSCGELADHLEADKSSISRRRGSPSAASSPGQAGTSFATVDPPRGPQFPSPIVSSVVRPREGCGRGSPVAAAREVIARWDTAHSLRTNVQTDSTRSTTAIGVQQTSSSSAEFRLNRRSVATTQTQVGETAAGGLADGLEVDAVDGYLAGESTVDGRRAEAPRHRASTRRDSR